MSRTRHAPARPHQYPADPTPKVPTRFSQMISLSTSGSSTNAFGVSCALAPERVPWDSNSLRSAAAARTSSALAASAAVPEIWQA